MNQTEHMLDQIAAILLDAGWQETSDAQWSGLLGVLPKLQQALAAKPTQAVAKEPVAFVDDAGVIIINRYDYKPGDKLYTEAPAVAVNEQMLEALHAMLEYTAHLDAKQGMDEHDHPSVKQATSAIRAAEAAKGKS